MMKIEHSSEPKEFVISKNSEFARVGRKGKRSDTEALFNLLIVFGIV